MVQQARNNDRSTGSSPRERRTGTARSRTARDTNVRSRTNRRQNRGPRRPVKIALIALATLVLCLSGFGWATMRGLVSGMTTADVIGSTGGGSQPADGSTDILLVGMDSRSDAQGNPLPDRVLRKLDAGSDGEPLNTDTMILLHIPNDTSQAVAISLPRDSYVDIPGYGKHKLNSAYARAKTTAKQELAGTDVSDAAELERRSDERGAKKLIESVESLVGRTIDHYAAVNLLGFYSITKAVGGVQVCLRDEVHDEQSGADFRAGKQTVAGADALAFVRQRHGLPRGDLDRVRRQQAFLAGVSRKILGTGTLTDPGKLSDLTGAIQKSVVLDQDWDIVDFAKRMRGLSGGQLEFHTIPVGDTAYQTPGDGTAVQVDPQQVREWLATTTNASDTESMPSTAEDSPSTDKPRTSSTAETNRQQYSDDKSDGKTGESFDAGDVPCVN